jgi:DNA-binding beta-propeller fold protein YncE
MNAFLFAFQHTLIPESDASHERLQGGYALMRKTLLAGIILAASSWIAGAADQSGEALKLTKTVVLPGYHGDFDHFAVDRDRGRILLAAEDHGTLEVFSLASGDHLRTVKGKIETPHSILVLPGAPTIFLTDSGNSMSKILDANTYSQVKTAPLTVGADSSGYDAASHLLYVVTGGKDVDMKTASLEAVDPVTGERRGSVTFNDNHVEAMALEKHGPRIFINLAQTNKIAVVDRKTMKTIHLWPVPPAQQNAMVAFDEDQHRLYVVCRNPAKVVSMNSDTGAVVSTAPAPMRADDELYDAAAHRLYVPGGEGYLGIYDTSSPDQVKMIGKVTTAPGAKTGLLLPEKHELVLAASPGDTPNPAKVLFYSIER